MRRFRLNERTDDDSIRAATNRSVGAMGLVREYTSIVSEACSLLGGSVKKLDDAMAWLEFEGRRGGRITILNRINAPLK
jgi:hypothetical protein